MSNAPWSRVGTTCAALFTLFFFLCAMVLGIRELLALH